jgi:hypothetical protein
MAVARMNQRHRSSCIWWDAGTPMPGECRGPALDPHLQNPKRRESPRRRYSMNSPHFWTVVSLAPHGMIGTDEVEFFGEPSISLSE